MKLFNKHSSGNARIGTNVPPGECANGTWIKADDATRGPRVTLIGPRKAA